MNLLDKFKFNDCVCDIGNPICLGIVEKVNRKFVYVKWISGCSQMFTSKYDKKHAETFLKVRNFQ